MTIPVEILTLWQQHDYLARCLEHEPDADTREQLHWRFMTVKAQIVEASARLLTIPIFPVVFARCEGEAVH